MFFDIGGVLLSSPFEAFAAYERSIGVAEGTIRRINATDPDTNAWAHLERGDISLGEFRTRFEAEAAAVGVDLDGGAVLECLAGVPRPEMLDALEFCTEHFTTAILTNNIVPMEDVDGRPDGVEDPDRRLARAIAAADAVVESARVGHRKPERRFYELACEMVGATPESVVFLDDLGVNLRPARDMGMSTIKVTDPRGALDELWELLGTRPVG